MRAKFDSHPALVPADYICKRLAAWAQQFGGTPLAGFFKPCSYLEAAARSGTKLSAGKGAASRL
jgi:enoyl-CoA hydratase/3-hydroxyacyl-CoA dehydrogenase